MQQFRLDDRVVVITGGAGLLGVQHATAVAEAGGVPVIWDIDAEAAHVSAERLQSRFNVRARGMAVDITSPREVDAASRELMNAYGRVDALVNNAARNPKVEDAASLGGTASRLEHLPLEVWDADLAVGLTGAFLCSRTIGAQMAKTGRGVIVNVASDLALIAPDQRLYAKPGVPASQQPVKPVTYSVVKSGLIGLTRYLSTYWADAGVRVNAICPGGVENGQDAEFISRVTSRIPMGRMATPDEYGAAIVFLCADASAYMTGATLVIDGGRTAW